MKHLTRRVYTLRKLPHFADDIDKCSFVNGNLPYIWFLRLIVEIKCWAPRSRQTLQVPIMTWVAFVRVVTWRLFGKAIIEANSDQDYWRINVSLSPGEWDNSSPFRTTHWTMFKKSRGRRFSPDANTDQEHNKWWTNRHLWSLLLTWVSYYVCDKMWDEITYPFLNFNGTTVLV